MVEFEADDAIAHGGQPLGGRPGASSRSSSARPTRTWPSASGADRVVLLDRRRRITYDEAGVIEKWGVRPPSIPDRLALVGDAADGFPGLPGWGAKSAAAVLLRYGSLEAIPAQASDWDVPVRGAVSLAATLRDRRDEAFLYRTWPASERDAPIPQTTVDELRWRGAPTRAAGRRSATRWGLAVSARAPPLAADG